MVIRRRPDQPERLHQRRRRNRAQTAVPHSVQSVPRRRCSWARNAWPQTHSAPAAVIG